jgi:4-amino-4-deoxy-L-arabinose transferase-like glycosyltransferase
MLARHERKFIARDRAADHAPAVPTSPHRKTLRSSLGAAALLTFAAALLLLPGLGLMAARDTTDARYLEIAREMWASGDWLVPRLANVPHLHKPPLTYWAAGAGFGALGVTPFAGRALEQAAVAATAVLILLWARRRIGVRSAWLAAGLFLTSGLVFATSRALHTDLFQLLFLTGALIALYEGSAGSVAATTAAGALLGLAMLAKGPIAFLVTIAVCTPFLALRRGERRLPWAGVALGLGLLVAIGLPWYLLMIDRTPSLLRWFAEQQVLARVARGTEGHRHGLLYLPAHVLAGTLPWTPLVLLATWRLLPRHGGRAEALDLFLLLWTILPCLFFEAFATKLATYLLPALPAAALLVARAAERRLLDDRIGRAALAAALAVTGIGALAASGLLVATLRGHGPEWVEAAELAAPKLFAVLAIAAASLRRATATSLALGIPGAAVVLGLAGAALAPGIRDHARDAELVAAVPGAEVIEYGVFQAGLLFYTAAPERFFVAIEARRARIAERDPSASHLGLRKKDVAARVRRPVPTFVLAKRSHAADLVAELGLVRVRSSGRYVLLANPAAASALEVVAGGAETPAPYASAADAAGGT